jgi:hypothetical protein
MKRLAAVALMSVVLLPGVAFASSASDAALGLGAFAVFNQILGGVGIFGAARPVVVAPAPVVVAPPPVYVAAPAPVYYAPTPPVYVAPPPPVYYAPAPTVYVAPRPVFVAPRPIVYRSVPPYRHTRWGHGPHH